MHFHDYSSTPSSLFTSHLRSSHHHRGAAAVTAPPGRSQWAPSDRRSLNAGKALQAQPNSNIPSNGLNGFHSAARRAAAAAAATPPPAPTAQGYSDKKLTQAQIDHLKRLFRESMMIYASARAELDRAIEREKADGDADIVHPKYCGPPCIHDSSTALRIKVQRAEAFVAKYVRVLSNHSIDTKTIALSPSVSTFSSPENSPVLE
ncbi:uncharacterized protein V1518DRAFT_406186 [Limtongia smithiae]|uniref:uncharacterized protein n=1 Tax=Limtongia smithiae TaxID=1125753 RepID=UPI0034CFEABF